MDGLTVEYAVDGPVAPRFTGIIQTDSKDWRENESGADAQRPCAFGGRTCLYGAGFRLHPMARQQLYDQRDPLGLLWQRDSGRGGSVDCARATVRERCAEGATCRRLWRLAHATMQALDVKQGSARPGAPRIAIGKKVGELA